MNMQITENLDIDVEGERWQCHHCGQYLGSAEDNYKKGCMIAERRPEEVWQPLVDEAVTFSYNGEWCRIVEFYCPGCGWLIELEVLPPGHPITYDIELDLAALRAGGTASAARRDS